MGNGAVKGIFGRGLPVCTQDPSLRLKNGSGQDDAHQKATVEL
jgi:hypothetical protein